MIGQRGQRTVDPLLLRLDGNGDRDDSIARQFQFIPKAVAIRRVLCGVVALVMNDWRQDDSARFIKAIRGRVFIPLSVSQKEVAGLRGRREDAALEREVGSAPRQPIPPIWLSLRDSRVGGKVKIRAGNSVEREQGIGAPGGEICLHIMCESAHPRMIGQSSSPQGYQPQGGKIGRGPRGGDNRYIMTALTERAPHREAIALFAAALVDLENGQNNLHGHLSETEISMGEALRMALQSQAGSSVTVYRGAGTCRAARPQDRPKDERGMSARVFKANEVISQGVARLALACVPLGIFSAFLWPGGADLATTILVLIGIVVLLRDRTLATQPALAFALLWITFLVLSAIYAMAWGAPGRPFKGLEKHLPLALGPLAAVALSAACHRLRFGFNNLLAVFLAGLIGGALAMLIRSGAMGMFAHGWPQFSDDLLGKVNRNYAALACGLSLIAITAMIAHLSAADHIRMSWRIGAIGGLALIFLAEGIFLAMLQSRTAYAATALGLAIWCGLVMRAGLRGADRRVGFIVPIAMAVIAAAGVMYYFPLIGERLSAGGSTAIYMKEMYELLRGNTVDASAMSTTGAERLQLVAVALDLIRQRPWFGWGPDASQLITLFSPYPDIRDLTQFHNGYLQVLVSFGLVGGGLCMTLFAVVLWAAWKRRRPVSYDRLAPPLFAACVALVAYVLLTNVTESIVFVKPVGTICMFLAALACMKDRSAVTENFRQN